MDGLLEWLGRIKTAHGYGDKYAGEADTIFADWQTIHRNERHDTGEKARYRPG